MPISLTFAYIYFYGFGCFLPLFWGFLSQLSKRKVSCGLIFAKKAKNSYAKIYPMIST